MYAKLLIALYRLAVAWGMIIRLATLLVGIPFALYTFIDPTDISEIAFSNLTLKLIGDVLAVISLSLYSWWIFFDSPNAPIDYIFWAKFPFWVALIAAVAMFYF